MRLAAIRRYPVKAMGGESLDVVEIGSRGLVGDRRYAVVDADGKFAAGKDTRRFARHDAVFDFTASTSARGVLVTGHGGHWWVGDPALDPTLSTAFGEPVQLREEGEVMHFDDSPVSVVGTASLQWCAERFGFVVQQERLRANLEFRFYESGHMTFVDEQVVAVMKRDLADFYRRATDHTPLPLPTEG